MDSTAAIITLLAAVSLLVHYSTAEFGDHAVASGRKTFNAELGNMKSGVASDKNPRENRSSETDLLQTLWCDDPLMTIGCRECEKSCVNPNPPALCAYNCHSTCICKTGLYRTFLPSPTCAPPNGPLLNNCKVASRKVKG
ncbi:uncharacterized protein LOC129593041 [Paramacrobiotus metropolitanus]|uniref:uncharacterized protein LOC129593041 n=1 Tax=Paramacrobiotus metropolitanus TaxID=2943436 RepID=UPI002445EC22|nr:uncharacterized protein LOC129593041 [Paramacrobiotus metropolitanus]